MKKLYKTSVIMLLLVTLCSLNVMASSADTLKIMQNNGELSLVVLNDINQSTALNDIDLKSIISGLEKVKGKIGIESVVVNGTDNNYQIIKKGELYYLSLLPSKQQSDEYMVKIYETTTRKQLESMRENASRAGIDIKFPSISIVDGKIDAITMEVDCNDGFSGNLSVTDIPDEGIGFIRDYSENASTPFSIGKIFGSHEERKTIAKKIEEDFSTAFNKESEVIREEEDDSKIRHDHELEIMLGLNNYLTPTNELPANNNEVYGIDPIRSWTYQINSAHEVKFSKFFQTNFMFGLQWYNFAFEDQHYQITKGVQSVEFQDTRLNAADINPTKSKLNITYLNAGIVPVVHFGKKSSSLRVGAGVYGGYRIGSKSKFKYDDNGKDVEKNSFYLNSWHYGVRAQIGWKGIDLFATYDLNPLFVEGRGPELNAFSFGIIL